LLSHEDGWFRDMAQRILVERSDPTSVAGLEALVKNGKSELGRFHALWTLEGLEKVNPELLLEVLKSDSDLLKTTALRQIERPALGNPELLAQVEKVLSAWPDKISESLALQLALSSAVFPPETRAEILAGIFEQHGHLALMRDAILSSLEGEEFVFSKKLVASPTWTEATTDREIFLEMLTTSVVNNGKPDEIEGLLTLADAEQIGWKETVILNGMAIKAADIETPGFVKLTESPPIFSRKDFPLDQNRTAMLKRIFSWPGYQPETKLALAVDLDEKAMKQFAVGRTKFLTSCAGCHGSNGKGAARMGPPLAGSEWVTGDEVKLSLILLHGIEGPIEVAGKKYDAPEILPVMPSHSTMDDGDIAAILTYIRNEWGNQAPPVTGRTVSSARHLNQGRVYPWSANELKKHIAGIAAPKP
jgi:mono/diheme cytochrome c family protein